MLYIEKMKYLGEGFISNLFKDIFRRKRVNFELTQLITTNIADGKYTDRMNGLKTLLIHS